MKHLVILLLLLSACRKQADTVAPSIPATTTTEACSTGWANLQLNAQWVLYSTAEPARCVSQPYFCTDTNTLRMDVEYHGERNGHTFLLVADCQTIEWGEVPRIHCVVQDINADFDQTLSVRTDVMHNIEALRWNGFTKVVLLIDGFEVEYAY